MEDAQRVGGAPSSNAMPLGNTRPTPAGVADFSARGISEERGALAGQGKHRQGAQRGEEAPVPGRSKPTFAPGFQKPLQGKPDCLHQHTEGETQPSDPLPPSSSISGRKAPEEPFPSIRDRRASQGRAVLTAQGTSSIESGEPEGLSGSSPPPPGERPVGGFLEGAILEAFFRERKRREDALREWEATGF